ncbi:hypothetical protein D9M71_367800 [compost metagenome]
MVDGAGDDVARGQFFTRVEARHETLAIGQLEQATLATQGFGNQEALGLRVVQAGRVELVELKVGHPATGTPGHGDAIAAGAVGVAGVQVDLGRAAGSQHGEAGAEGVDLSGIAVQDIGPQAAIAVLAQAPLGDQVDCHPLLQQLDVRAQARLCQQGGEDRRPRGIGGVDDAPMAVAAFTGQVEFKAAVFVAGVFVTGKRHALVDQPLNRFAAMLNGEAHGVFMAQAAAGIEGVFDVGLHRVGVVQHRGHATLGPEGRAIGEVALAEHGDAQVTGEGQGQAEAGGAAADHENIMLELLAHVRTLVSEGGDRHNSQALMAL